MTEKLPIQISKACEYLIAKAYPAYDAKTCGHCAEKVRQAWDFALGKGMTHTLHAKDYGPIYQGLGFRKIFSFPLMDKKSYIPQIGDLCIIQYEPDGHICVKTAQGWISDFKQGTGGSKLPLADMYGGHIRDKNPPFDIYRFHA